MSTFDTRHEIVEYLLLDDVDDLEDALDPLAVWRFDTEADARQLLANPETNREWAAHKVLVRVTRIVEVLP